MNLDALAKQVVGCQKCELRLECTAPVSGIGTEDAQYFIMGKFPGREEDLAGIPEVGMAGRRLNRLLDLAKIDINDCYITNVIKCASYNTQVFLASGKTECLGKLVTQHYTGFVETPQGYKKVVGWHSSPVNGRRVFRVYHKFSKRNLKGIAGATLTEDNPILTKNGWVLVKNLFQGEEVNTGTPAPDELLEQIILGSLLGDGAIQRHSFVEGHGVKQVDYLMWKSKLLSSTFKTVFSSKRVGAGNGKLYDACVLRTLNYPYFHKLQNAWYPNGKKIVPMDFQLTTPSLAIWYLDDGHVSPKKGLCELAAHSFTEEERTGLVKQLATLGYTCYSRRGRIYFNKSSSTKLLTNICSFVPSSMAYKLNGIASAEGEKWMCKPLWFYSPVQWEARILKEKTVYCIDVEDAHCFRTPLGFIHNCKPPTVDHKIRTPTKKEIKACLPWLLAELEAVKFKQIITLGDIPLSLFSEEGIRTLHGTLLIDAEIMPRWLK